MDNVSNDILATYLKQINRVTNQLVELHCLYYPELHNFQQSVFHACEDMLEED